MLDLIDSLEVDLGHALTLWGLLDKPGVTDEVQEKILGYIQTAVDLIEPATEKEVVLKLKLLANLPPPVDNYEPEWTKGQLDYFNSRLRAKD